MNRRLAAVVLLGLLPWTVVVSGPAVTLIFALAFVDLGTVQAVPLYEFLYAHTRALPRHILAWPLGAPLYALALASVAAGALFDREDRRITALALVLFGLSQLSVALGFTRRLDTVAIPIGTILAWAIVAWRHGDRFTSLSGPSHDEDRR